MTSSRFGILIGELNDDYEFKNDVRKHEIDTKSVSAHINFSKPKKRKDIEIISGTVIDYINAKNKKVEFDEKKVPHISESYNIQPHQIDFFILNKKYIQTELNGDMPMLMRNVNHSLPTTANFQNIQMFIEKINADYPKQWYAFEQINRKHVSTSKVMGNDIVKDHKYGGYDFKTVPKNDIGISDKINGKSVELRISKKGLLQFPENRAGQYYPNLLEIGEYFVRKMSFYAS